MNKWKCKTCPWEGPFPLMVKTGNHMRVECPACGVFIKFASKKEVAVFMEGSKGVIHGERRRLAQIAPPRPAALPQGMWGPAPIIQKFLPEPPNEWLASWLRDDAGADAAAFIPEGVEGGERRNMEKVAMAFQKAVQDARFLHAKAHREYLLKGLARDQVEWSFAWADAMLEGMGVDGG